jgi:regulatory protein
LKVTAIKQRINQPHRYSILIDGKYLFSLSDTALLDHKLVIGQNLSEQDLEKLNQLSIDDKAYSDAVRFATMRIRSEWELSSYLKKKKISQGVQVEIISKLINLGLIDDLKFAQSWVATRQSSKMLSRRRLEQELKLKHVRDDIIRLVLVNQGEDDLKMLKQLIEAKRRMPRYRNNDLKLMQYLSRQGYDYGLIKDALSEE